MFRNKILIKLLCGLAALMVFASCSPAPTAEPTVVPTIDVKPTFDTIATQSVATAIAEMTLNAPSPTPVPPTNTPEPTATPAPSNTPEPTATATQVFIPWTKTPTATVPVFSCTVTDVSPKSTDTIKVDQDFDGRWMLKNSGTSTRSGGNIDVRYVSGTKLHSGGDLYDLSGDVAPNGTTTIAIDMRAPSGDGTFTTTWGLYQEGAYICQFSLTLNVSK
jgi:hypothetical protein